MRKQRIIVVLSLTVLLNGCWDQRQLKNIRMAQTVGVDLLAEDKIRLSVSIPTIKAAIESQGNVVTPKVSGEGHSVQEASLELQTMVSQHMDLRETRVLLVNKAFAEKSLYETLDYFYREAQFPISIFVAITDGFAQEVVDLQVEDRSLISEYLYDLLESNEEEGMLPSESPFLISSIMSTPGFDNVLPIIEALHQKKRAKVSGLALFHGKQMTGKLDSQHARSFVLLTRHMSYGTMTEQIGPEQSYLTFMYKRAKHKVKITTKDHIAADIYLMVNCFLIDNPTGTPLDKNRMADISQRLEKVLSKRAEETIRQLQRANCDGLGIGLQMKALHQQAWRTLDWNKEFPKMKITPHVQVKIKNHGLLN
ncbi:Ger(x)C family spore germination protein [Paenibacillus sp. JDR-2]|uniref:Ger(x)C family spore germination protein n=1 Tax=Paenibacillus sp. (strain JDR-2) TaxID=324057 RepID=UPI000166682D|nr:Ger(x)C family spore germination protein [Paenibacillus sp. JDR-2]ACT02189.1 germination protein, Ger(x)C family [Paenibacillus sp. JDR-2]